MFRYYERATTKWNCGGQQNQAKNGVNKSHYRASVQKGSMNTQLQVRFLG